MGKDWGREFSAAGSLHVASAEEQKRAQERRENEIRRAAVRAGELRAIILRKVAEDELKRLLEAYKSGETFIYASIMRKDSFRTEYEELKKINSAFNYSSVPDYCGGDKTCREVEQIMNKLLGSSRWAVHYVGKIRGGSGGEGGEEFHLVQK